MAAMKTLIRNSTSARGRCSSSIGTTSNEKQYCATTVSPDTMSPWTADPASSPKASRKTLKYHATEARPKGISGTRPCAYMTTSASSRNRSLSVT